MLAQLFSMSRKISYILWYTPQTHHKIQALKNLCVAAPFYLFLTVLFIKNDYFGVGNLQTGKIVIFRYTVKITGNDTPNTTMPYN